MNRKAAMSKNLVLFETCPLWNGEKGTGEPAAANPFRGRRDFFPGRKGSGGFWPGQRIFFTRFLPKKGAMDVGPFLHGKAGKRSCLLMQEFAKM